MHWIHQLLLDGERTPLLKIKIIEEINRPISIIIHMEKSNLSKESLTKKYTTIETPWRKYENLILISYTIRENHYELEYGHENRALIYNRQFCFFVQKSTSQIYKKLLDRWKIPHKYLGVDTEFKLEVQYNESALNFLTRIGFLNKNILFFESDGSITIGALSNLQQGSHRHKNCNFLKVSAYHNGQKTTYKSYNYLGNNPDRMDVVQEGIGLYRSECHINNYKTIPSAQNLLRNAAEQETDSIVYLETEFFCNILDKIEVLDLTYSVYKIEIEPEICKITAHSAAPRSIFEYPIASLQRAIVGHKKALYKDGIDYVFVKFYCDSEQQEIPLQLMHKVSSKESGDFNVPREGDEVIIDFLNQDPRDPIIIGSCFNSKNLCQENNSNIYGFVISSQNATKRNNFLKVHTEANKELVDVKAEKDMQILVNEGNLNIKLEGSKTKYHTDIQDGDSILEIKKGNQITQIENEIKLSCTKLTIECKDLNMNATNTINMSSRTISIKAQQDCTIQATRTNLDAKMLNLEAINLDVKAKILLKIEALLFNLDIKTLWKIGAAILLIDSKITTLLGVCIINSLVSHGLLVGTWIPAL